MIRISADVGGTFTDIVVTDGLRRIVALKVPSTPDGFERGVLAGILAGLDAAGAGPSEIEQVVHGTTAGTNAVLERSGPLTALVTTKGFRDVLEIGRLRTPTIYDLAWQKPPPLVPRWLRLEMPERIGAGGEVLEVPDPEALIASLERAVAAGVQSVAISFINSYANPSHERSVGAWIRSRYPDLLVTVGTDVVREIGEFERTSTAVLNAYLRPVTSRYLDNLARSLARVGSKAPVLIMQSSGGMMPVDTATRLPVHLLESGPAAGVLAAAHVARSTRDRRVISFDMGGTTAKASLIEDFEPLYVNEFSIGSELSASSRLLRGAGYTVRLPVVDLAEVGAGGGSIARVDGGGALEVGPASAGAHPGPACYSHGGTAATITDANLLLGYVSILHLAESGVQADPTLAEQAVQEQVAEPLGLTVPEAALAIHNIANQRMAKALRAVSTERGRKLDDYTLVAFGGCGGLHAATLAATVGMARVVVPPFAGVLSAVGLLRAPVELSATETIGFVLDERRVGEAGAVLARLAEEQEVLLRTTLQTDGDIEVETTVDLRYVGEGSELSLPILASRLDLTTLPGLLNAFHQEHLAVYGHGGGGEVELVRARSTARQDAAALDLTPELDVGEPAVRAARFDNVSYEVPVVRRGALREWTEGPLLVDESDTTTVVPPGWRAQVDPIGNLILEVGA